MEDGRQFRVLRDGASLGIGTAREARDHAVRGDLIQNVATGQTFSWWPELGGEPTQAFMLRKLGDLARILYGR